MIVSNKDDYYLELCMILYINDINIQLTVVIEVETSFLMILKLFCGVDTSFALFLHFIFNELQLTEYLYGI